MTTGPRWFAAVGAPLAPSQRALVLTLLSAHALVAPTIAQVTHWSEAAGILWAVDGEATWWNIEEEERERLWEVASLNHTEDALLEHLAAAEAQVAPAIAAAATAALARSGLADPKLAAAAGAAATLAVHQRALARIAGAPESHLFALKYRLFAEGHLPLGYHAGRYLIF